MRRGAVICLIAALTLLVAAVVARRESPDPRPQAESPPPAPIKTATPHPRPREHRQAPPRATMPDASPRTLHVRLRRAMSLEFKRQLERTGFAVMAYLGEGMYAVSRSAGADMRTLMRPEVADVSEPAADAALSAALCALLEGAPRGEIGVRVVFWPTAGAREIAALLREAGAADVVVPRDTAGLPRRDLVYLDVAATPEGVRQLVASPLVQYADLTGTPRLTNQTAVAAVGADLIQPPNAPYNLDGTGEVVGVWDGRGAQNHTDFGGRVQVVDPFVADNGGLHATSVIGTLLGSGAGNPAARGFATGATAFSYDFYGSITMERRGLHHANRHAIENHSWNVGSTYGGYDATAREFDFDAKDLQIIICRAAGNQGNGDGTIYSDLSSKNNILIGAVDDNGLHTSNTDFSSRGPMNDGRLAPHICANGIGLTTTYPTNAYTSESGTSFACPGVTGTVAMLSQLWRRGRNNMRFWPDAAAAVLYQTAVDRGNPGPDYQYGFGVLDAKAAADLILADEASGGAHIVRGIARQDDTVEYDLNVGSSATPLKVTLHWHDTPAAAGAAVALVNDLDLELVSPTGAIHYPYSGLLAGGSQTTQFTQTGPNRRDNTEQAVVVAPQVGTWRVRVRGYFVADPTVPAGFVVACDRAINHNHVFYEDAASAPNNGTPVNLPDNDANGLVFNFNVTQTQAVEHVRLYVGIVHALRGQIDIRLTHPDGTEIRLEADENGVPDGNREDLYAIYPETRPGFEDVTPLYGKPANGLWTIRISDRQPGQPIGVLHYVALELEFDSTPGNDAPTADAGPDQNAFELEVVTLNGGGSSDPELQPLTYQWTQISGPPVNLSDAAAAMPTFTAPLVNGSTQLVFHLLVKDNAFSEDSDTVTITVMDAPNGPPVANAGADQLLGEGVMVILDGSASSDPDSHPLTYTWTQLSGPTVALSDTAAQSPTFLAPFVTSTVQFVFRLQVADIYLATSQDTVLVEITDTGANNQIPTCNAGSDQVRQAASTVTLDGTASSDPEGWPLVFAWQQISGATAVTLNGANTAMPTFTAPQTNGPIVFRLVVSDVNGGFATDTVTVTIIGGIDPVAATGGEAGGCASSATSSPVWAILLLVALFQSVMIWRKSTPDCTDIVDVP